MNHQGLPLWYRLLWVTTLLTVLASIAIARFVPSTTHFIVTVWQLIAVLGLPVLMGIIPLLIHCALRERYGQSYAFTVEVYVATTAITAFAATLFPSHLPTHIGLGWHMAHWNASLMLPASALIITVLSSIWVAYRVR